MDGANGHKLTNGSDRSSDVHSVATEAIVTALQAIYDSRSSNSTRQEATQFLEAQKEDGAAAEHGFALASNHEQPAVVRHFGCSLLEHTIRHRWQHTQELQRQAIRSFVLKLAYGLTEADAQYFRGKVANIWVELAKKSWGIEWVDMDSSLLDLWVKGDVYTELVLAILEALSEDIFYREDSAAALRGTELSTALVEVFCPAPDPSAAEGKIKHTIGLRADASGWLAKISELLSSASRTQIQDARSKSTMLSALQTLRSVLSWVMLSAVMSTGCFQAVCGILAGQHSPEILLVSASPQHAFTAYHMIGCRRGVACSVYSFSYFGRGIQNTGMALI